MNHLRGLRGKSSFGAALALSLMAPPEIVAQSSECGRTSASVEVNGARLHYFECGAGAPVVFVHGTTGDLNWAVPHADALSPDFRLISYSRRYHHPNEPAAQGDEYALAVHVADLASLIERLDLAPAQIVGHSYGAYVALALALERTDLVRSLVLGEPPVLPLLSRTAVGSALRDSWNTRTHAPARDAAARGRIDEALRRFLDAVIHPGWFDQLDPQARRALIEQAGPEFQLELGTDAETYMPPLACEDLADVRAPTLLMAGEQSIASLYLVTAELERCLENESFVMIPDAGHVLFANPSFFDEALREFLTEHR